MCDSEFEKLEEISVELVAAMCSILSNHSYHHKVQLYIYGKAKTFEGFKHHSEPKCILKDSTFFIQHKYLLK